MNGFQQLVRSAPSVFPTKAHKVNQTYTQEEAQNVHLQRIFYIRVAVLNATLLAFSHYRLAGEEERKKERKKEEEEEEQRRR